MNTHTQLHVASKVLNLTLEEINNIAQEYSDVCIKFNNDIFIDISKLEKFLLADEIYLSILLIVLKLNFGTSQ